MSSDPSRTVRVPCLEDAIDQALLVKASFSAIGGFAVIASHKPGEDQPEVVLAIEGRLGDAPRADLRPRMAQAHARYWGRYKDFTEAEAFEQVRGEED